MKKFSALLLALWLFPSLALAVAEMKGTVIKVDKIKNEIVVKTQKGEEMLLITSSSKGLENAKEGAQVTIKYSEKDGLPKVIEIIPGDGSPQAAPGGKSAPRK